MTAPQLRLCLALLCAASPGCHARSDSAQRARYQGWERCDHGRCKQGFVCRYDRDQDGGMLDRCVPEPGRCRWNSDCLPMQRCVRQRPDAVGLCWDRPPT